MFSYCCWCCCCWVANSCLILSDPMDSSLRGFLVPHPLHEFAEVHVHWVGDAACPLSWWCRWTISSSASPFSSCLQSFPRSRSFLMSQLFISGGQSTGASASASVLPKHSQGWFPLRLTGYCSWGSQGKNIEVVFHSLLQWTMFCQNSPLWLSILGGPTQHGS